VRYMVVDRGFRGLESLERIPHQPLVAAAGEKTGFRSHRRSGPDMTKNLGAKFGNAGTSYRRSAQVCQVRTGRGKRSTVQVGFVLNRDRGTICDLRQQFVVFGGNGLRSVEDY